MPPWITFTLQLLSELPLPAIAVTVILALVGASRRRRQSAADRRRAVVVRVLGSLEATVRRGVSMPPQ